MDILTIIIAMVPALAYAITGLAAAVKGGEAVRWFELTKTIVLAAVSAGLLTETIGNMALEILATTFATWFFDTILNNILKAIGYKPTQPPEPAPS